MNKPHETGVVRAQGDLLICAPVWELAAAAAFARGVPPPRTRDLPEEVTDLWIGRLTDGTGAVWRFADGGWNFHRAARGPGPFTRKTPSSGSDDRTEPATT